MRAAARFGDSLRLPASAWLLPSDYRRSLLALPSLACTVMVWVWPGAELSKSSLVESLTVTTPVVALILDRKRVV